MPICLLSLSNELISIICEHLSNHDIKSLRLACLHLGAVAPLRLDRVFLSANPRNVEAFNSIASHDVFRKKVVEIVWDDVLLMEGETAVQFNLHRYNSDGDEYFYETPDGGEGDEDTETPMHFPKWFDWGCRQHICETVTADAFEIEMPDWTNHPMLPISECWDYYQQLLREQHDVLESQAHVRALEDAWRMRRFPAVRTITITPAAHGRLFYPLFETPMIRAFPPGFVYPLQRGWPFSKDVLHEAKEWDDEGSDWSGFRVVTSVVAKHPHDLAELRVDGFLLPTGLNACVFEENCRALEDFTTIITRSSFHHLHLDLLVGGQQHRGWAAFMRGHLARVLSEAKLQSLSIRMDIEGPLLSGVPEYYVPLRTVFSPDSLACLRHFSLSGFHVRESEVLEVLADLPLASLQTVEISFLVFLDEGNEMPGYFRGLLERMRKELSWQDVKVAIGDHLVHPMYGRAIWVDVSDFIYRGGDNPFSKQFPEMIDRGFGIEKDLFNSSYERPYFGLDTAQTLGYRDWSKELESIKFRR